MNKKRLLDRFRDSKTLKISEGDIRERISGKEYQKAYEECIRVYRFKSSLWYRSGDDKGKCTTQHFKSWWTGFDK